MTTFRNDGLDNPLSPNSGTITWRQVDDLAQEVDAVAGYTQGQGSCVIEWCDGTTEEFVDATAAYNAIRFMQVC